MTAISRRTAHDWFALARHARFNERDEQSPEGQSSASTTRPVDARFKRSALRARTLRASGALIIAAFPCRASPPGTISVASSVALRSTALRLAPAASASFHVAPWLSAESRQTRAGPAAQPRLMARRRRLYSAIFAI